MEYLRLGTLVKNKSRPLKCVFNNADEVVNFFSKSDIFPKDLKIIRDRTILQRKALKEAIEIVKKYKSEGNNDYIIRYIILIVLHLLFLNLQRKLNLIKLELELLQVLIQIFKHNHD